jgi:hypothetical protein
MVYFMLTRGEVFVGQGQQRYEEQHRRLKAARRRAGLSDQPDGDSRMKAAVFASVS